jgi:hypothetical protein
VVAASFADHITVASIDDYGCVVVSADGQAAAAAVIPQKGMVEPGLACIAAQRYGSSQGGNCDNFFTAHMMSKRVALVSASSCRLRCTLLKSQR